jgi:hypothetical protein
VRWPSACEDVSLGAQERPLLEDVTKQSSEDCDWSVYDSDLYSAVTGYVFKSTINPIINSNPVYRHLLRDNKNMCYSPIETEGLSVRWRHKYTKKSTKPEGPRSPDTSNNRRDL